MRDDENMGIENSEWKCAVICKRLVNTFIYQIKPEWMNTKKSLSS